MIEKEMYTPGQAARKIGISVKTIHRWDKSGKIKAIRTEGNHRRIPLSEVKRLKYLKGKEKIQCGIYARVSTQKQEKDGNLERQKERLVEAAKKEGYEIKVVITERSSGINEKRRGLKKLIQYACKGEIDVVLIEFKDRLARFGFAYIEKIFEIAGVRVEVLEKEETKEPMQELVKDLCSIITVFSARLYGSRGKKFQQKVQEVMKECEKENG